MSILEERINTLRMFIYRNRNRKRVAYMAGVHRTTIDAFVLGKRSISMETVLTIDKVVTKITNEEMI